MAYEDVRQKGTGKLLFRYDPEAGRIQVKINGCKSADTVDLAEAAAKIAEKRAAREEDKAARPSDPV